MRDPRILLDAVMRAAPSFRDHYAGLERRRDDLGKALLRVLDHDVHGLEAAIREAGRDRVGARPTAQHQAGKVSFSYPGAPVDRDDARRLATRALQRPMAFVDGSQVEASRDVDVPFGLVTISGSHAHPGEPLSCHDAAQAVTPAELASWQDLGVWNPDRVVNLRRWTLEVEYLIRCMEETPGTVAVLDGTLVHSFTTDLPAPLRQAYSEVLGRALRVSKEARSPLVGFVASSHARDLVELVRVLEGVDAGGLTDPHLLAPHLETLGARTPSWWCDRGDGSLDDQATRIAFHYARLGPGGPCRMEYPEWMLEEDGHEVAHEVLLAQCLAFGGYPRSIDECHVKCQVTSDDAAAVRDAFFRLAQEQGLPVQASWKARSKQRGTRV